MHLDIKTDHNNAKSEVNCTYIPEKLIFRLMSTKKTLFKELNYYFIVFLILLYCVALTDVIDPVISQFILTDYRTLSLVVFLISLTVVVHDVIFKMLKEFKRNKSLIKKDKNFISQIRNLKAQEKFLLSYFVDKNVLEHPISNKDPALGLLESKKLLIRTETLSADGKAIYRIDPVLLEELKLNPNLLY